MKLIILDLVKPDFKDIDINLLQGKNTIILALTPSSFYLLESYNILYMHFHSIISQIDFRNDILKLYEELFDLNKIFEICFIDLAKFINYFYFIEKIVKYIKEHNFKNIIYITDKYSVTNFNECLNNKFSLLYNYINFDEIIHIKRKNLELKKTLKKRLKLKEYIYKLKSKIFDLQYDWMLINPPLKIKFIYNKKLNFKCRLNNFEILKVKDINVNFRKKLNIITPYKVFLNKNDIVGVIQFKQLFFFQHGSYLYKNVFLKFFEVKPAYINFVFNDYTKKLFKNLGAKKVYSVGSILFNKPIKERKKEYDYLYITQGHDYTGNFQYVDFPDSLHSFDGSELYQRHKNIIKLFGEKFKDKKIIIRVLPTVITNGVYVPFWELAKPYPNVIIDVSIPIHNLIEESKYIISDYFTSEFINRELHYKRDIILFQGAPTPLPEETIEDMKKMFILVDTVNGLEDKIRNIDKITKNRKRYDDIIEYYSSKKCDTKKEVLKILKKELNENL